MNCGCVVIWSWNCIIKFGDFFKGAKVGSWPVWDCHCVHALVRGYDIGFTVLRRACPVIS